MLVVLTSIHWREAWKYGERAFSYCQHDLGHAIAAMAIAANIAGWQTTLAPSWPHARIAALAGLIATRISSKRSVRSPAACSSSRAMLSRRSILDADDQLSAAVQNGRWQGRASQLSEDHVQWTFIDEIAAATRDDGRPAALSAADAPRRVRLARAARLARRAELALAHPPAAQCRGVRWGIIDRPARPSSHPGRRDAGSDRSMGALWWQPQIHLAVFVHRVEGLEPGLYLLVREETAIEPLRHAIRPDFLWEPIDGARSLFLVARGDCRGLARRLSCDQEIAADGFFSLGMIARFDDSLAQFGPSFYRHLFWESGVVGQVLYLAAEAAGARATGIGCFYDDPVHDVLGLRGHAFQSLYHFTIGMPVEDRRLTTRAGVWVGVVGESAVRTSGFTFSVPVFWFSGSRFWFGSVGCNSTSNTNREPRTEPPNPELRTPNRTLNTNREPRTEKGERQSLPPR